MAQANKFLKRIMLNVEEAAAEPGFKIAFVKPDHYDSFYVKMDVEGGYYAGITIIFELSMKKYPLGPPHFKVLTPEMWHPNVSKLGTVCVDFLYDETKWVKEYTIVSMFQAFKLLLVDANCDGGHHNAIASALWRDCLKTKDFKPYIAAVKANTGKYNDSYEKYFKPESEHFIIPKAAVVVSQEQTATEQKEKVNMLATKFAKFAKPKAIKPKEVDNDNDRETTPKSESTPKSTPKSNSKLNAKKKTTKSKKSDSDNDNDSEEETTPKPKPKPDAKKKTTEPKKSKSKRKSKKDSESESESD